jgi:DNA gyrase subunit A
MVNAMIPVTEFSEDRYLLMGTRAGTIKKTPLSEFRNPRKAGIIAVTLDEGDELVKVLLTDRTKEVIMVSKKGKAIRFFEEDVRPMGRAARGVRGMTLYGQDDEVVSMDLVDETTTLLTVTENGFGKRTEYSQYPAYRRGGKGVITIVTNTRNGSVSKVKSVAEYDELMFTSADGIIIRIPAKDISIQGRNTQGVRIMNLRPGDKVVGVARIKSGDAEKQLNLTDLKASEAERKIAGSEDESEDIGILEYVEETEDIEKPEEEEMEEVDVQVKEAEED